MACCGANASLPFIDAATLNTNPSLTDDLTAPQAQAVQLLDGPLLILAGPGSGKTRVITRRIANLLEHGVHPRNILAITFTNKAAREMAERVEHIAPGNRVWISTFHRFCAKLLRQYGEFVGLKSNFSILDTSDQKQMIRRVLHDLDFDPVHFSPDKILWRISTAKNDLITPEAYQARYEGMIGDHWQAAVNKVYPAYQKRLLESNAVDFDDLLMHAALLLAENPELRRQLDERYQYVLVDEYQDTNSSQYQIVSALSQMQRNLCVTGDPDQSIYGWRGARIANILQFEREFPEVKVVRLEQNFRSTKSILNSADALIVHNSQRKHKDLLTDQGPGEPVQRLIFDDSNTEADGIAQKILQLTEDENFQWGDFAIFYRVNSLSRQLEHALTRFRIPYQVAAGVAFFDRAEIRDLLAYLRLIENPAEVTAFLRIVNKPLRGLGQTSQNRLLMWAAMQGLTPMEACANAEKIPKLSKKAISMFKLFARMLNEFSLAAAGSVADLLQQVIELTRYAAPWEGIESEEAYERLANIEELVSAARQYDQAAGDDRSLQGFLEQTALVSDTDKVENDSGRVTLMTLHAAKGLEFPAVFIVGVEDGLIPHERSKRENDRKELEEERRLLFVGMTRARKRLFLTETRVRAMHGRTMPTIGSPFMMELISETVECGTAGNPQAAWASVLGKSAQQYQHIGDDEESIDIAARDRQDEDEATESPVTAAMQTHQKSKPMLMTAADLLKGGTSAAKLPVGFGVGQMVRHPRYGVGMVTAVGGFGPHRTVTVTFHDKNRQDTFVLSKAPLQPIG
ncbi:ATP-dependent helicase [Planctomicrobium sp. SH668]|uniref:ATP-dependent helicase n=1 Tax=Planctomicrobium sp. SH668 TaxID=3448126 RepID=UPI003F5CB0D9